MRSRRRLRSWDQASRLRTGNKLVVIDSTSGAAVKRIQSGEVADVALLTGAAVRNLPKQGKLDPPASSISAAPVSRLGCVPGLPSRTSARWPLSNKRCCR